MSKASGTKVSKTLRKLKTKVSKFKESDCYIPTLWCGEKNTIPTKRSKNDTYYYKVGSRYECLKVGFGAGSSTERKQNLPLTSIEQIKYIGDSHSESFRKEGVSTTTRLITMMKGKSIDEIETYLKKVLKKSNDQVDMRAYNSVLLYLYRHGISELPKCAKIRI